MAIIVPIVSSWNPVGLNKAIADIKRAEGAIEKFSATSKLLSLGLMSVGKTLTTNVTVPLVAAGFAINKTIQGASDLNETITKTEAIFGDASKELKVWAKGAATAFGMSQREALDAAGTFGLFGKVAGLSGNEVSTFAQKYTGLAADFASFYNTSPQDAIVAIGAALRGESEPIRRYNILLDEMTIKNRAVSMGIIESTTQALTPQQKVLARSAEIMAQSTVAQGDFARTAEGLANQQRILKAETKNLSDSFGAVFLPTALSVVGVLRDKFLPFIQRIIGAFQQLSPQTKQTAVLIGIFAAALGPAIYMLGLITKGVAILADVVGFLTKRIVLIPTIIALVIAAFVKGNDATMSWGEAIFKVVRGVVIGFVQVGNAVSAAINIFIKGYNAFQRVLKSGVQIQELGNMDFLIRGIDSAGSAIKEFTGNMKATQQDISAVVAEAQALSQQIAGGAGAGGGVAGATDKANKQLDIFKEKLDNAKSALADAKQKFDDFAKSIAGAVKGVLNFGEAATAETGTFLENLITQADKAKEFAKRISRLIELGLSESAITQVLDAGTEAGIKIADEIIAGGATVVDQVNTLVKATESLAEQVGQFGAEAFYGAGVKQGQALVDGIIATIKAAGFSIDANGNIVAPLSGAISTGTPTATTAPTRTGGGTGGVNKPKPKTALEIAAGRITNKLSRMPAFANGGIVTSPTVGLIGEAGPEAVIPLSRLNKTGGTYNITVNAGMGANGTQIGKEIVDAIKRYERSSGPVFASV